jgi:hypothetical protein
MAKRKGSKQQRELDIIQGWIADTTEDVEDWDWTGKELTIFGSGGVEKYSRSDVDEFIFGKKKRRKK